MAVALLLAPGLAAAQDVSGPNCAKWRAQKGYSRDYVEQRTGRRPPSKEAWKSNVAPAELAPGDVVMLSDWSTRVGVIEEVERDGSGQPVRLRVTSQNGGGAWVDRACWVTREFGVVGEEWVRMDNIVGIWRLAPRR